MNVKISKWWLTAKRVDYELVVAVHIS